MYLRRGWGEVYLRGGWGVCVHQYFFTFILATFRLNESTVLGTQCSSLLLYLIQGLCFAYKWLFELLLSFCQLEAVCPLSSDLWHQQSILAQRTAAHWIPSTTSWSRGVCGKSLKSSVCWDYKSGEQWDHFLIDTYSLACFVRGDAPC